jgi:hypothetical protein
MMPRMRLPSLAVVLALAAFAGDAAAQPAPTPTPAPATDAPKLPEAPAVNDPMLAPVPRPRIEVQTWDEAVPLICVSALPSAIRDAASARAMFAAAMRRSVDSDFRCRSASSHVWTSMRGRGTGASIGSLTAGASGSFAGSVAGAGAGSGAG